MGCGPQVFEDNNIQPVPVTQSPLLTEIIFLNKKLSLSGDEGEGGSW